MLHLISKTRFESFCLGKEPVKVITGFTIDKVDWPYYEISKECWFMYLSNFNIGLIFGNYKNETLDVTFDDWTLTKISDKPNPKYILNIMKACLYIQDKLFETCDTGDWKLENKITGESKEFTTRKCGYEYYPITAIGYEEKLKTPIIKQEIKFIDSLINTICYGIRRNDTENSVGSKSDSNSV